MDIEFYRAYCISKNGVTEQFPFDSNTLVFKVGGKMFSLLNIDNFDSINLKCDPEKAIQLREQFPGVIPGFHMNKNHWNTVSCEGSVPDKLILEWTDDSYNLVLNSLPKKLRFDLKLI